MPNYDFQCPACRHTFEENLTISERGRDDVLCPKCGKAGAKRLLSAPNIGGGHGGDEPRFAPT
jgi:putative FmdB family regulatory protein